MTKSVSIAHLKANLAQVGGEVQTNGRSVVIEKRGRPVAVLVPVDASRPAGWAWLERSKTLHGLARCSTRS